MTNLRKLVAQSRHLDVRNAAQAQLDLIARRTDTAPGSSASEPEA